jgi:hypothetical protein
MTRSGLLCITSLLGTLSGSLSHATVRFEPPYHVQQALGGWFCVSVDYDNDGRMDVLVSTGGALQLLTGNGNGTFAPYRIIATGTQFLNIYNFAVAELNGDGRLDVVACDGGTARTYLANVDGTLYHDRDLPSPSGPNCVVAADLNHDGWKDVVVASKFSDKVTVFRSGGWGGFYPGVSYVAGSGATAVAVEDFNGDGHLDIVAVNSGAATMTFHPGDGTGVFGSATSFATPPSPSWIAVTDLNEDGLRDAVVTSTGQNKVSVFLGNGAGGFGARQDYATGSAPGHLLPSDIDGDDDMDIVSCDTNSRRISIHYGLGNGLLVAPRQSYVAGALPRSIAIADFNGDTRPDILAPGPDYVGYSPANVILLLSNESGGFPAQRILSVGQSPRKLAALDVNDDGFDDLLVPNAQGNSVSLLVSNGDGTFLPRIDYPVGLGPMIASLGDVDNDSRTDFVTADIDGTTISVSLAQPGGGFSAPVSYSAGNHPSSVALGDYNEDGFLDIAVSNLFTNQVTTLTNLGNGTFGPNTLVATADFSLPIQACDLNEDGHLDLMVGMKGQGLRVLAGNGNGTFQAGYTIPLPIPKWVEDIVATDLNNDGHRDVVLTVGLNDNQPGHVVSLIGDGTGALGSARSYAVGPAVGTVVVSDLNGDGWVDFVGVSQTQYMALGMFGDGTGAFQDPFRLGTQNPYSPVLADVNGDGEQDLVTTNVSDHTITLMLNLGDIVSHVVDNSSQVQARLTARPNPAGRAVFLYVDVEHDTNATLRVYDANGRLVENVFKGALAAGTSRFQWKPGSAVAKGSYFIHLSGQGLATTTRVVFTGN